MTRSTLARGLAVLTAAIAASPAFAQDFPNRSIRLIVPYGTGGITDIGSRIVAPRMGDILGQQVVVENRPGGAAIPGFDIVAKAKPDGYTVVMATTALAANHVLFSKIPYDAARDFAAVSLVAIVPTVLVVHPSVPANNVRELIALAKTRPLFYGSAGNGSANHLTTEVFKNAAGVQATHVPYKGGGAVMTDLVAGQVSFVFAVMPTAFPFIQSGKLRPLGVSSARRQPAMPEVPTVAESGVPGFDVSEWLGLLAPAGTPPAVVSRLQEAVARALAIPEVSERLRTLGAEPVGSTPQELDRYYKSEIDRWTRLSREVKFQVAE